MKIKRNKNNLPYLRAGRRQIEINRMYSEMQELFGDPVSFFFSFIKNKEQKETAQAEKAN